MSARAIRRIIRDLEEQAKLADEGVMPCDFALGIAARRILTLREELAKGIVECANPRAPVEAGE